jgi:hypothetical protein
MATGSKRLLTADEQTRMIRYSQLTADQLSKVRIYADPSLKGRGFARTIGNVIYVDPFAAPRDCLETISDGAWLAHELAHVHQYATRGFLWTLKSAASTFFENRFKIGGPGYHYPWRSDWKEDDHMPTTAFSCLSAERQASAVEDLYRIEHGAAPHAAHDAGGARVPRVNPVALRTWIFGDF